MTLHGKAETMKTWLVTFGEITRLFFTRYHMEQFTRALRLNKTPYTIREEIYNR